MRPFFTFLCLFIGGALFSPWAWAQTPSFDCHNAKTPAEIAICNTPSLAAADETLANAYQAAQSVAGVNLSLLKGEELAWLRARNTQCVAQDKTHILADKVFLQCLEDSYQNRIAELNQAGHSALAPCMDFAASVKPLISTNILENSYVADALAAQKGSPLTVAKSTWVRPPSYGTPYTLDKLIGTDYTLKSTYVGTASHQLPHLYQQVDGVEKEISVPPFFSATDGEHAGEDRESLISLNGVIGLMSEYPSPTQSSIEMSLKEGDKWTPDCTVNILKTPHYQVAIASFATKNSTQLTKLIEGYVNLVEDLQKTTFSDILDADLLDGEPASLPNFLSPDSLPPTQAALYSKMVQLSSNLPPSEAFIVPFFGSDESQDKLMDSTGCRFNFVGRSGMSFPILLNGEVMIGLLGLDGYLESSNYAAAVYTLEAGKLQPYAGFCITDKYQTLESVTFGKARF